MASIYQNSVFTIAVPRARSAMEGIFPEAPDRQYPFSVKGENARFPLNVDTIPLDWDQCIEGDALSERAWVLQERLLSCRTLFFSHQQMFWECRTLRSSQHQYSNLIEDEDKDITKVPDSQFNRIPEPKLTRLLDVEPSADHQKPQYQTWHKMIEVYSGKSLTVASDKLPALAGIAKAFKPEDDLYLAGTWMKHWKTGLLWAAASPRCLKIPKSVSTRRAPSWSWARLDGPIRSGIVVIDEKDTKCSNLDARLVDIGCKESDFLGKESEITITLEGHAEWVFARSKTVALKPPSTFNDWTGTYDDFTGNWEYTLDQEGQSEPVRCLRLIIHSSGSAFALLLNKASGSTDRWERIGIGFANSSLVDLEKLSQAKRETVTLY
jgi:hypothetical protein